MHYLFIAEKPSLRKAVEQVYNSIKDTLPYTADFTNARGHVIRLAKPQEYDEPLTTLPIIPKEYKLLIIEENRSYFNQIKTLAQSKKYDAIVNTCDPEREGQYIFYLITKYLNLKQKQLRFWSNDLSPSKIEFALRNLRDNSSNVGVLTSDPMLYNLTQASILRGQNDWLVGMNYSKALNIGAGRVRTTVLAMVVARDEEIENFVSKTDYEIDDLYKEGFKGTLQTLVKEEKENKDGTKELVDAYAPFQFESKEEADAFIRQNLKQTGKVASYEKEVKKRKAPKLFKLSDVQAEGNKAFGYGADKVLDICQNLYEGKILSYPRTDCPYISSEMVSEFPKLLRAVACIPSLSDLVKKVDAKVFASIKKTSQYVNDKELAESGHSALVPTGMGFDFEKLSKDEQNIITLIYKRFLAIFFPPVVEEKTIIMVDNNGHLFKANGKVTLDKGYLEVFGTNVEDTPLPSLKVGDMVSVQEHKIRDVEKKPPQHFTEGTLIQAMENPQKYLFDASFKDTITKAKGIGTSATRSAIIKKIIADEQCKHLKSKGKAEYIVSTQKGRDIIHRLEGHNLTRVDMTAMWEQKLSDVATGKLSFADYEREMIETVIRETKELQSLGGFSKEEKEPIGKCPFCGGDVMKGKNGYYCKNVFDKENKCGFSINDKTKDFLKKWDCSVSESSVKSLLVKKYLVSSTGAILTPYINEKGYMNFDIDTSQQKKKSSSSSYGGYKKGSASSKKPSSADLARALSKMKH